MPKTSRGMRRSVLIVLLTLALLGSLSWGSSPAVQAQGACPVEENRSQEIVPLLHDIPVEGTVRSTSGNFGSLDTTQYAITVPASVELDSGQAKLELGLVNLTERSRNIDLIVRVGQPVELVTQGSRCLLQADHFARSRSGEEALTIDGRSRPPLQATTYYIAVLNFEFDRPGPQAYRLVARLTPAPSPLCSECFLVAGEAKTGQAAPQSLTAREEQFILEAPAGAKLLAISLVNQSSGILHLHMGIGRPVEQNEGSIQADFSLLAPSGPFLLSGKQLRTGTFLYFAVENIETFEQTFALTVLLVPHVQKLTSNDLGRAWRSDTGTDRIADERLRAIIERQLQTSQGRLALTQYALSLSRETRMARVEVTSAEARALRVHVRLGQPVEITNGRIVADLSASVKDPAGSVIFGSGLHQAGTYYIAVEGIGHEVQEFELKISTEGGS
jgi:hypothetical protein